MAQQPQHAVPQSLTDAIDRLKGAASSVAEVVASLRGAISTAMTQADVDAVQAKIDEVVTGLQAVAADPNAPVPPGATTKYKKK